jgi:hypothetical protein
VQSTIVGVVVSDKTLRQTYYLAKAGHIFCEPTNHLIPVLCVHIQYNSEKLWQDMSFTAIPDLGNGLKNSLHHSVLVIE